jgi:hypothetical protein
MTPQDKAKKLFQLFGTAIAERVDEDGFVCNTEQAKQCALIMIEEMLCNSTFLLSNGESYFWHQVKKEIENL